MSYQKSSESVSKEHSTTPEVVDSEMQMADYNIEPSMFIALATVKAKKTIYCN